jgi:hypothetical protein
MTNEHIRQRLHLPSQVVIELQTLGREIPFMPFIERNDVHIEYFSGAGVLPRSHGDHSRLSGHRPLD